MSRVCESRQYRLYHVDADFARLTPGFARVNQDCAKWNSVGGCVWVILPVWLWEGVEGVHSEAVIVFQVQ